MASSVRERSGHSHLARRGSEPEGARSRSVRGSAPFDVGDPVRGKKTSCSLEPVGPACRRRAGSRGRRSGRRSHPEEDSTEAIRLEQRDVARHSGADGTPEPSQFPGRRADHHFVAESRERGERRNRRAAEADDPVQVEARQQEAPVCAPDRSLTLLPGANRASTPLASAPMS